MRPGKIRFRFLILGLLSQQPMSGYDIKRFLEDLSWLIGNVSFGGLYPVLHALLDDGMVTVDVVPGDGKPSRKIYTITEIGRGVLKEWAERPVASDVSLKAFAMCLILAGSFSHAGLVARLEQRRTQVLEHEATLVKALEGLDQGEDLGQSLALEYGLAIADAESAWLNRILGQLSIETEVLDPLDDQGV
jgi:DNA-binding PadR family transcriptional regulator